MVGQGPPSQPLSRARVLLAAATLADTDGIAALTIRSLAAAVGVKPMSLYHHVANKEDILDGLVDLVFAEVDTPQPDRAWQEAMRGRSRSLRAALNRHPWAIALVESRSTPGLATLRHHDAVLGVLRDGGLSVVMAAHAYSLLDSFVYGFAVQEQSLPFDASTASEAVDAFVEHLPPGEFPHLREIAVEHAGIEGYDYGVEFEYGLELVLDALTRAASR